MRFENHFEVAGPPAEVIAVFADVPLVASFLPGAAVGERAADGSYPGTLTVAFGPKRLVFRGTLTNEVDAAAFSGQLGGTAAADVRGARMAVKMEYRLSPLERAGAPGTRVDFISEAQLTGVLAEFANTGGVAVTDAILQEFAHRFSAHVAADQPQAVDAQPAALSVAKLGSHIALAKLRGMAARLACAWRKLMARR